jgi:hypothetical protein
MRESDYTKYLALAAKGDPNPFINFIGRSVEKAMDVSF